MAWLRATPEEQEKSRWAQYVEADMEVPLPSVEGYEYILAFLESAGTILQTGMGIAPLTWQEIESWERVYSKELVCSEISFWELDMVKGLSYEYCSELSQAKDKGRQSPYSPVVVDREDVSRRMYSALMSLKRS